MESKHSTAVADTGDEMHPSASSRLQSVLESFDQDKSWNSLRSVLTTLVSEMERMEAYLVCSESGHLESASAAKFVEVGGKAGSVTSSSEINSSFDRRITRIERTLSSTGGLRVGDVVRIDGLDNIAHLSLNGKKAQVRRWEGPGGRWVVQVLQTNELKSLKVENLIPLPKGFSADGQSSADARPEGQSPDSADEGPGAKFPRSDGGGGLSVGDIVEICKLRRTAHLNKSRAEILSWDDEGGRWLVKLKHSGRQAKLRTGNLRRVGEASFRVNLNSTHEKAPASSPRAHVARLEAGMLVELCKLNTKTLNGMRGHLRRWDDQSSRWVVQMLSSKEEKSLRADNLREMPGSIRAGQIVAIADLGQAAHLNGLLAEVLWWDAGRCRWAVQVIDADEEKLLRPENLVATPGGDLHPGCGAIISGVQTAEELNGRSAKLVSWSAKDARWLVQIDGIGQERKLKPRRLRLLEAQDKLFSEHVASADNAYQESDRDERGAGQKESDAPDDDVEMEVVSDDSEEADVLEADDEFSASALRNGMAVTICGGGVREGEHGTLVRWEDAGGIFGEWVVRIDKSQEMIRVAPGCLMAVSA